jgi:hypothetical protein
MLAACSAYNQFSYLFVVYLTTLSPFDYIAWNDRMMANSELESA